MTLLYPHAERAVSISPASFRTEDAANYQAWVTRAAKQPMALESVIWDGSSQDVMKSRLNTVVCVTPMSQS